MAASPSPASAAAAAVSASPPSSSSALQELVPPINFSLVCPGVYRSGYPTKKNYPFLRAMRLKSILYLCPEEYAESNLKFCEENGISVLRFATEGNKEPFSDISEELMHRILTALCDTRNHPIVIHCNKGKHRTGTVCGCLRRLQGWSLVSVLREYVAFAGNKSRVSDQTYLELYRPIVKLSVPFVPRWLAVTPGVKFVFTDKELAEEGALQLASSPLVPMAKPEKASKKKKKQQQQQQSAEEEEAAATAATSTTGGVQATTTAIAGGGGGATATTTAAAAAPNSPAMAAAASASSTAATGAATTTTATTTTTAATTAPSVVVGHHPLAVPGATTNISAATTIPTTATTTTTAAAAAAASPAERAGRTMTATTTRASTSTTTTAAASSTRRTTSPATTTTASLSVPGKGSRGVSGGGKRKKPAGA